jgi:hypothetical protein
MVFDPSNPVINESGFELQDWTSSEPRGLGFVMRAKVDADHASDATTRRSRTGFLVDLNCAPIYWMSKK